MQDFRFSNSKSTRRGFYYLLITLKELNNGEGGRRKTENWSNAKVFIFLSEIRLLSQILKVNLSVIYS